MTTKKRFTSIVLVLFALLSFACQEEGLVHGLNERDATDILVLLSKNNVHAKKVSIIKNQETFWIINVKEDDATKARAILVANNLPRVRHGGLEGICKDAGLILTPKTEKCREILAYKGEIINSLESIPGVVSADIVLNIPDKEEFPSEDEPTPRPSAAVTIQYLSDANVRTKLTEGKVQEFVSNSVNGLDSRDVAVIISYLEQRIVSKEQQQIDENNAIAENNGNGEPPNNDSQLPEANQNTEIDQAEYVSIGGLKMAKTSAKKFKVLAVVFLLLLLILAAAFIFALLRMSRLRKQGSVSAKPVGDAEADQKLLEAKG
jgi:type III secretion system YscJ/HrcJ family lipoprotein